MQNNIAHYLNNHRIIPVVNFQNESEIEPVYNKLKLQGISCIEITLRSEFAWKAIETFKNKYGNEFSVGVGTVVHPEQVFKCQELKVDFIVCPGLTTALIQPLEACGIAFLPGVSTPSEIMRGMQIGWKYFKFFPANLFGGVKALKTFQGVFPEVQFCPTGGINSENLQEYLSLTNVVSVGGSWTVN